MSRSHQPGARAAEALRVSGGLEESDGAQARPPCPPRRAGDEAGYERWLAHVSERLDPFMAFLGIVFALLAVFELADPGLSDSWSTVLSVGSLGIWGVFLADFAVKLVAAPSAPRYLRRHWLSVAMLLVPTLRVLRLGALLRLGRGLPAARVVSTSYRAAGIARRLLGSRTGYLAGISAIATLAIAQLAWLVERGRGTFDQFGDALLWAATTVVGMQGDPVPETTAGRLVMLCGFTVGLVLIATLAGTVGAFLLEARDERAATEDAGG